MNFKPKNLSRLLIVLLVVTGNSIFGQNPSEYPDFRQLRYEEDWSFLRDKSKRKDYADRLKYIPLGKNDWYLTIGGEERPFYEFHRNENWGSAPRDDNGWVLQRYMLHADVHFGKKTRVFAQIKSGLINNRVGGPRAPDLDKLDLNQLFLDYKIIAQEDRSLIFRLGRQEISFGSARLVSTRENPNVRQSFDGIRLSSKILKWSLDAFAVKPVSTDRGYFDDKPLSQQTFSGIYVVSSPGILTKQGRADFYYFGLGKKTARYNQGTGREIRHSIGTRVWSNSSAPLDYNFEFVFQFGKFGAGRINAWSAASDTGYTLKSWPFMPRFGLKADVTSGDESSPHKALQTFNSMFPRGAYFTQFAPIGPYNHTDLHSSAAFKLASTFDVSFHYINYWRTSRRDGVYNMFGTLIRNGNQSRERFVGTQYSVDANWKLDRHTTLTSNLSHFGVGKFLRETPPDEDTVYFAVWVTHKF